MARSTIPGRTRSKAPRRILITVIVLVVLLVAADRIGDAVAENVAGSQLQSSQHLTSKPDVDIAGFPFLSQFASGNYDEVTVTAKDVRVGNGSAGVTLAQLRVVLNDLTVSRDFHDYRAQRATAVGVVGYDQLSSALGVDVSFAGGGRIKASKKITVFGQTITPTVTARPELVDGALSFAKFEANDLGALGGQLSDIAGQILGGSYPLRDFPFDVTVRALQITERGLQIDLAGTDLSYSAG